MNELPKGFIGALFIKDNGTFVNSGITGADYRALQSLTTALQTTNKQQAELINQQRKDIIALQSTVDEKTETIKGMDRRTQRYSEIIEQYRKEAKVLQRKIDEQEEAIKFIQRQVVKKGCE